MSVVTADHVAVMHRARDLLARLSAWPRRWTVLPIALAALVLIMTALGLSGSSAAMVWPDGPGPVVGEVRPIRSDEWWVRTPMIVHQSVNGFPDEAFIGMGSHDQGVVLDLPTSHASMLLRPHLWAYRVLPLDQAFAFEWWGVLALGALGPYALLWLLTRRAALSGLLSVSVVASPVVQWWTNSITGTTIGYLCLGAAVLIAATRSQGRRRLVLAGAAGYVLACAAAVPYPAWLLPLGLALAPLVVVALLDGQSPRAALREKWLPLAIAGGVAAVGAAMYALVHRDAIEAIVGSVYPGDRNERGGSGEVLRLLGAPFYWYVAHVRAEPVAVLGTNESEAAGPLFLVLPAVVAYLGAMLSIGRSRAKSLATAALVGAAGLLTWFLVPIPASLGGLVGLDQVPPNRLLHTFAPVGAICLGLVVHAVADLDRPARRRLGLATGVVVFLATAWAGGHFIVGTAVIPTAFIVVVSVVFAVACALTVAGVARTGAALLAMIVLVAAMRTTPLQDGLGPLRDSPLVEAIRDIDRQHPGRWVAAVDDWTVIAGLVASGVDSISGASVYPNDRMWRLIDPDESDIDVWNRYAHVLVVPSPSGAPTAIGLFAGDAVTLSIDLCGPDALALGITMVIITVADDMFQCGTLVATSPGPSGELALVALAPG
ncbi:MAG: hypothetical protein Q7V57_19650 [Actinomycetota bacterium]|nr:hypothetical protein [Actinomycetota bacterium]